MKNIKVIFTSILILAFYSIFAQQTKTDGILSFSLKQAQDYGEKNSYKNTNAEADIKIAKKKVSQITAVGFPQLNASAKYQNYIDIPTSLMPDFLTPAVEGVLVGHGLITSQQMTGSSGATFPVQFGTKHNFSADITASQLLFDGSYIVGLQAAKAFVELSSNSYTKSVFDVKESIAQAYYLVLVALENKNILDTTLTNLNKVLNDTKKYLENGFIEETDMDQLIILVSSITNKLNMVDRQIEIAFNLLKFQMGIDLNQKIILTDKLKDMIIQSVAENLVSKEFDYKKHIDYKLLKTTENLSMLNLRKDKYAYLPSLSCFITTSRNAQRSEFDFFKKDKDWYKTTIFGVGLSLPIWDSGIKHFKIQQDNLELEKTRTLQKQLQQALELDVQNSRSTLKTYTDQYQSDFNNMQLAKKIYDRSIIKYNEGVSTSLELTQTYNQYLTSQGTYLGTVLELLKSKSNLNKALNNY